VEVFRNLLNHGVEVYIANKWGWTTINAAAFYGHVNVVRELLNRGDKLRGPWHLHSLEH
jgi:ankyrin repeat protein